MRISSINVAQPRNVSYNLNARSSQNPNFEGKGGVRGLLLGTAVGGVLTLVSGGALAWTIPLIGGAGGISGDVFEKNGSSASEEYRGQTWY